MKRSLALLCLVLLCVITTNVFAATPRAKAPNQTFPSNSPATTNNDDSCDIGVFPAATLLLPYFEVDFTSPQATARTTIFTITNTSRLPQIAHVVLWTDMSFAALDFNIFLTGYDVQSINMADIFVSGTIAPNGGSKPPGTTNATTVPNNSPITNAQPASNITGNANFLPSAATACVDQLGQIPPQYVADLRTIFTTGVRGAIIGSGCTAAQRLGLVHANAIGYVTIDVAATCSTTLPGGVYFQTEMLFDNVLIGDYQDVNPNPATGNYAGGNPLVHIRAVPEGGPAGSVPPTNLPYTFYDRFTAGSITRTVDRRQPLPALFAARFIEGGTGAFNSNYKIWREGISSSAVSCNQAANSTLAISEFIRFDEHENATASAVTNVPISPPIAPGTIVLPETSSTPTANTSIFPPTSASGDVGGWMYLNLNNGGSANYSAARPGFAGAGIVRASQNWVIVSMAAQGRFAVDFDAAMLGNGCNPAVPVGAQIAPAGGVLVCPPGVGGCTPGVAPYTGTNVTP